MNTCVFAHASLAEGLTLTGQLLVALGFPLLLWLALWTLLLRLLLLAALFLMKCRNFLLESLLIKLKSP